MVKKFQILLLFFLILISTSIFADNGYTLNITNNTTVGAVNLILYCSCQQFGTINPTGVTSFNVPAQEVCIIKNENQIFVSLKQDSSAFTIQETPQTGSPWQDLLVSYSNSAGGEGAFHTVQLAYSGDCHLDGANGYFYDINW